MPRPTIVVRSLLVASLAVALAACGAAKASGPGRTDLGTDATSPTTTTGIPVTSAPTGATSSSATSGSATPPSPGATAGASAPATGAVSTQPITIAFAGDVHGEPPIEGVLASGKSPIEAMIPLLTSADLAMVNLETTVGNQGPAQVKKYVFQSPPSLLAALKAGGVDVVTTANNHSFDHGRSGLLETLGQIKAAGLVAVGSGQNATEAYTPAIVDVRGTKVAVLGIARVGPDSSEGLATATTPGTTDGKNLAATLAAIRAARAQAPIVIVMIHWGIELATCPQIADRDFAQAMLDAGATAVIGAHPHVLQGLSTPPDKLVAYSMGNFVFYAWRAVARTTGVLTVTFSTDGKVLGEQFDPARIDGNGHTLPVTGADRDKAIAAFNALRPGQGSCH